MAFGRENPRDSSEKTLFPIRRFLFVFCVFTGVLLRSSTLSCRWLQTRCAGPVEKLYLKEARSGLLSRVSPGSRFQNHELPSQGSGGALVVKDRMRMVMHVEKTNFISQMRTQCLAIEGLRGFAAYYEEEFSTLGGVSHHNISFACDRDFGHFPRRESNIVLLIENVRIGDCCNRGLSTAAARRFASIGKKKPQVVRVGAIHRADEFGSPDIGWYQDFDFVLRNYYRRGVQDDARGVPVSWLPLPPGTFEDYAIYSYLNPSTRVRDLSLSRREITSVVESRGNTTLGLASTRKVIFSFVGARRRRGRGTIGKIVAALHRRFGSTY
jgi:hypothetical protein